jgi:hypothetical protein
MGIDPHVVVGASKGRPAVELLREGTANVDRRAGAVNIEVIVVADVVGDRNLDVGVWREIAESRGCRRVLWADAFGAAGGDDGLGAIPGDSGVSRRELDRVDAQAAVVGGDLDRVCWIVCSVGRCDRGGRLVVVAQVDV